MTDIYELFKKEIWKPADLTKTIWYHCAVDELTYSTGTIDELMNGEGDTYSFSVSGEFEKDGFVIFDLQDDYGGPEFQAIFDLSKKQDEDAYWESVDSEEEDEDE